MKIKHWLQLPILAVAAAGLLGGCALYREDRCWIPPEQYGIARDLFIQTGSLELVEQRMEDYQWRRCRINEALYRLQKEFEVLPEELPPTPDQAALEAPPTPPEQAK